MMKHNIGILLTNIGTPAHPTPSAVKQFLHKFLSDPRVVDLPRIIWWPILHGFILRNRPKKTAKLYQKIWTAKGSPLLLYSKQLATKLQTSTQCPTVIGMHYSDPSIEEALNNLRLKKVKKIFILPLYPQYSATTTGSTLDQVASTLKQWRDMPEIQMIAHYAEDVDYISSLQKTIQDTWKIDGRADHLLFSFHGIPERYCRAGDPYPDQCRITATDIAHRLGLTATDWSISFQSRLGHRGWQKPYTDQMFLEFPKKGITNLQVICPGFAVDCLETLEEIAIRGKAQFLSAGGKHFRYISSLNDTDLHVDALKNIIHKKLSPR